VNPLHRGRNGDLERFVASLESRVLLLPGSSLVLYLITERMVDVARAQNQCGVGHDREIYILEYEGGLLISRDIR
jgi:hypothetical protein